MQQRSQELVFFFSFIYQEYYSQALDYRANSLPAQLTQVELQRALRVGLRVRRLTLPVRLAVSKTNLFQGIKATRI